MTQPISSGYAKGLTKDTIHNRLVHFTKRQKLIRLFDKILDLIYAVIMRLGADQGDEPGRRSNESGQTTHYRLNRWKYLDAR